VGLQDVQRPVRRDGPGAQKKVKVTEKRGGKGRTPGGEIKGKGGTQTVPRRTRQKVVVHTTQMGWGGTEKKEKRKLALRKIKQQIMRGSWGRNTSLWVSIWGNSVRSSVEKRILTGRNTDTEVYEQVRKHGAVTEGHSEERDFPLQGLALILT